MKRFENVHILIDNDHDRDELLERLSSEGYTDFNIEDMNGYPYHIKFFDDNYVRRVYVPYGPRVIKYSDTKRTYSIVFHNGECILSDNEKSMVLRGNDYRDNGSIIYVLYPIDMRHSEDYTLRSNFDIELLRNDITGSILYHSRVNGNKVLIEEYGMVSANNIILNKPKWTKLEEIKFKSW